jgi:hypothetical protein
LAIVAAGWFMALVISISDLPDRPAPMVEIRFPMGS